MLGATCESVAELHAQHQAALQDRAAALAELSAALFNRPQLHDTCRHSAAYRRWQACAERVVSLERRIGAQRCPRA